MQTTFFYRNKCIWEIKISDKIIVGFFEPTCTFMFDECML